MIVSYTASAFTPAGWRSVTVTAEAEVLSPKRVRIARVVDVNGDGASGHSSVTGAKRQAYNVGGIAAREAGKIKNLSSCTQA